LVLSFLPQAQVELFSPLQVVQGLCSKQLEVKQELFSLLWVEVQLYFRRQEVLEPFSLPLVQEVVSKQLKDQLYSHWVFWLSQHCSFSFVIFQEPIELSFTPLQSNLEIHLSLPQLKEVHLFHL